MLTVEKVDTNARRQVRRFVEFPYRLYRSHAQWVPPLRGDIRVMLDRRKYPFYEHSDADFFVAERDGEVVGWIAALQRAKGRLTPWALVDLLLEMRQTKWLALNGAGLVPEFHGVGGNAFLYAEMENTIRERQFEHADLTQVAETAVQMRHDLENVGGKMYKNHRVYRMAL